LIKTKGIEEEQARKSGVKVFFAPLPDPKDRKNPSSYVAPGKGEMGNLISGCWLKWGYSILEAIKT